MSPRLTLSHPKVIRPKTRRPAGESYAQWFQLFYGVKVLSIAEMDRDKSSSLMTATVETREAEQEMEAHRVLLLELSEELSQAGEDFLCFCIFVSHLQR